MAMYLTSYSDWPFFGEPLSPPYTIDLTPVWKMFSEVTVCALELVICAISPGHEKGLIKYDICCFVFVSNDK